MNFNPPPPPPANDLPPPPALAKAGDDPPKEAYEHCPWAADDGFGDDDRADGAEHDWLYQRRNGYDEIYDPWAPEEREQRKRDRIEREEQGGDPFNLDDEEDRDDGGWTGGETGPKDGEFAPDHDRT